MELSHVQPSVISFCCSCWSAKTCWLRFSRLSWAVSSLQRALTRLRVLSFSKGEGRPSTGRCEEVPPNLLPHSLGNPLSSTGMAGWWKRAWRKEAASLESLSMHGDSISSPSSLPRARAALEISQGCREWLGRTTTWFWGQGQICVSAEALQDGSLQAFAFLAQNGLKHIIQRQTLPSFRSSSSL